MNKNELIFSGIGGQGTILMGQYVCFAASKKGYSVTLAPAYGQEKRGGRASCQVVISEEMDSPVISAADTILVLDEASFDDYENRVKPGGTLIVNSSMITKKSSRADIKTIEVPFTKIATDIGNAKASNMVALGVVAKTLNLIGLDDLRDVIKERMKPAMVDVNVKALEAGYTIL